MFRSLITRIRKLKGNLTMLDGQPLSKAALVVIAFLDIFILVSIFDGLADHTRQLAAPEQHIPQYCRDIVIDGDWNATNRLGQLAEIVSRYHGSYYIPDERDRNKARHEICTPFVRVLESIKKDESLSRDFADTLRLRRETTALRAQLERVKGAYDTSLLENIARQGQGQANVGAIKNEIAEKTRALDERVRKRKLLESSLEQDERVRGLFALVAGVSQSDRNRLLDDLRQMNFWYPVKRLAMEMVFLLPLFIVFYFWNAKSIAANRPFQTLVSSHLLVVVLIPVLFKIADLVYDIIPKKLLQRLIELLESLKLVALWHYLLIGVSIAVALALIYLFQKKLFSREKLIDRRISKGLCQDCGQRLPEGSRSCPFCGFVQYRTCSHCSEPTHVLGRYCRECGQRLMEAVRE